jgi:hypothetical protein
MSAVFRKSLKSWKKKTAIFVNNSRISTADVMMVKDKVKTVEMERDHAFLENQELKEYLDFIEETTVCSSCSLNLENTGKPVDKVGERQKRRKVKELKTRSERALWFMESFGFKLDVVTVSLALLFCQNVNSR